MAYDENQISDLFMPYAADRLKRLQDQKTKFVHYTSASVAMQILDNREFWMRNARLMNDFSEVQHGQNCLLDSWKDSKVGGRLKALLDRLEGGLSDKIAEVIDNGYNDRTHQSFLTSVSEHGGSGSNEEKYGRLSMWRAYGGGTNVAIVLNARALTSETSTFAATSSPVLYADSNTFKRHFSDLVTGLETNYPILEKLGPKAVSDWLVITFHYAILSTKHPGFEEEKEWRVIYSSTLNGGNQLNYTIETIQDVPQKVYKIPFGVSKDGNRSDTELDSLISEIIIGPTPNPIPVREALALKLESAGVKNAMDRVKISNIPLRGS